MAKSIVSAPALRFARVIVERSVSLPVSWSLVTVNVLASACAVSAPETATTTTAAIAIRLRCRDGLPSGRCGLSNTGDDMGGTSVDWRMTVRRP